MTIRTAESVFLGVVVNPKTKAPVYVVREPGTTKNIQIWTHGDHVGASQTPAYYSVGRGYLEDNSGSSYQKPCDITGLPRAHTPGGVNVKGMGFGTCLYTGLVLLAVAAHNRKLYVPYLCGDGYGVSSDTDSRSEEADDWWKAALRRGMVEQQRGDTEDKEELENEDVERYVSRRGWRNILEAIEEAIGDTEWNLQRVRTVEADLERTTPGDDITADIYTMDAAESANLVAVNDVAIGDIMQWAKLSITPDANRRYKDVILALNVANEDSSVVGKLALIARGASATDREITAMLMRNRFGRDVHQTQTAPPLFPMREVTIAPASTRTSLSGRFDLSKNVASGKKRLPPASEPGHAIPNPAPIPLPRRNPPTPSRADDRELERAGDELERRRADLGWDKLEDLP